MVSELRTVCDLCREPAAHAQVPVSVGLKKHREASGTLDLCARCHKELLQPVVDALNAHGRRRAPSRYRQRGWKRTSGPYLCQAGCNAAPLKTGTTLEQHLLRVHDGLTLEEYTERHGELVPLTEEELAELVVEVPCPQGCGQVYSTALGHRWPQSAMIHHMWGHHGIKWRPGRT